MATQFGQIKGIKFEREAISGGGTAGNVCFVTFTLPAYTTGTDTAQLGGGGFDRGAATTLTLAQIIQNTRRDGKTVTLLGAAPVEAGSQGGTLFYAGSLTPSAGNVTFALTNLAGTGISAASGVQDRAISVAVSFSVA